MLTLLLEVEVLVASAEERVLHFFLLPLATKLLLAGLPFFLLLALAFFLGLVLLLLWSESNPLFINFFSAFSFSRKWMRSVTSRRFFCFLS